MDLPSFAGSQSDGDSFQALLRQALQYEPLDAAQEIHEVRQMRRGDPEARARLLQSLYLQIVFMAKRFWRPGISIDDLVQEGCIGALEGMEYYDEQRSVRLGTFLQLYIRKRITEHLWTFTGVTQPPRTRREVMRRVKTHEAKLRKELGREPTTQEVADRMRLPVLYVDTVQGERRDPFSLDGLYGGWWLTELLALGDDIWGKSLRLRDEQVLMVGVREALGALPEHEGKAAWLLFGCDGHAPLSLRELGEHLPYSFHGLRKLHAEALRQIHQVLLRVQPGEPSGKGRKGKKLASPRSPHSPRAVDNSQPGD